MDGRCGGVVSDSSAKANGIFIEGLRGFVILMFWWFDKTINK